MKNFLPDPERARWRELIDRNLLGQISAEESLELEEMLGASAVAREDFRRRCNMDAALRKAALSQFDSVRLNPLRRSWFASERWGIAAGIAIGLFCASVAWAMASPRLVATASRVPTFVDGSFEKGFGLLPQGFPTKPGLWSGDEAEVVATDPVDARKGTHMVHFLNPGGDANDPSGNAISCDIVQLVDLRSLQEPSASAGDSVLELSADFLDGRRQSRVSVTFTCQMFLFRGDPAKAHENWPLNLGEVVGSGTAQADSLGGATPSWKTLTARSLLSAQADYAVVQISARANIRPTKLESLYVDDVKLTLKTQPTLPVRILQP